MALIVAASAQPGVTVDQLVSFIKSAVQSKQDDKKVADAGKPVFE